MKYKGIDLVEMCYSKWDGKNRRMLVWNKNDIPTANFEPSIKYVVGMTDEKSYTEDGSMYDFCADIPYTLDELKYHIASNGFDGVSPDIVLKYLCDYTKLIEKSREPIMHHYTEDDFVDGEYYNCTVKLFHCGKPIYQTHVYICRKYNGRVTLSSVDDLSTCINPENIESMTPYKKSRDFAAMADQLIKKLKEWERNDA